MNEYQRELRRQMNEREIQRELERARERMGYHTEPHIHAIMKNCYQCKRRYDKKYLTKVK